MKFRNILFVVVVSIAILSCNKDDDSGQQPSPTPENRAPEAFNLLAPENGAEHELLRPEFSWQAATDPDGDTVTYDVYLGKGNEADSLIAKGILETHYMPMEELELFGEYSWKVVAKDKNDGQQSTVNQEFTVDPLLYLKKYEVGCQPNGVRTVFEYDGNDRLIELASYQEGGLQKIIWGYDSKGRLIQKDGLEGKNLRFIYDDLDRNTKVEFRDNDGALTEFTILEYDSANRLVRAKEFYATNDKEPHTIYRVDYPDGSSLPSQILVEFSQMFKNATGISLKWDTQGNVIEIRETQIEIASGLKNVLLRTFEYDELKNPLYTIYKKFKLPDFHYAAEITGSDLLFPFGWVSKNNITLEYAGQIGGKILDVTPKSYEYNKQGYPIKMTEMHEGNKTLVCYTY